MAYGPGCPAGPPCELFCCPALEACAWLSARRSADLLRAGSLRLCSGDLRHRPGTLQFHRSSKLVGDQLEREGQDDDKQQQRAEAHAPAGLASRHH